MLFSSITFLYIFLPCMLAVYFAVPKKLKNSILLLSGLLFYAWGEPKYVFLMIFVIVFNYFCGLVIGKYRTKPAAKISLIIGIAVNFSILAYFKYANFFAENFNAVFGTEIPLLNVVLPVGISFYTFQIAGYIIDVYKGKAEAQKNIISLGAYTVMFPQLVAGPIVRYTDVNNALVSRTHTIEKAASGLRRFIIGLSKKVIVANSFGELCRIFGDSDDKSVVYYWLYAVSFTFQIYYDFSGYSDLAIGLGKIFGFDFPENFNFPYISRSVTEFWRRWHRSLGSWFRDYLYIPLGGSRTTKLKHIRNILVVWLATGLWHGAAWNFLIWGMYFGVLLIIEKVWLYRYLEKSSVLSRVYLMFLVIIGFVIFNAASLTELAEYFGAMFALTDIPVILDEGVYYLKSYIVLLIIGAVGATPLPAKTALKLSEYKLMIFAEPVVLSILFIV
ncbi:MAG: MBOAT family protein, partial [Oscillospiraceae bacterium]|nr:MBOAT family protein [Oscillospiraceae bacterium]